MVLAAFTVAVQPAGAATFRMARATDGVSTRDASVVASERPSDASAMPRTEGEANFGGAAYSPFAEAPAKPARQDIQTIRYQNAEGADLTLSALTILGAVGALIYLARRAWAA